MKCAVLAQYKDFQTHSEEFNKAFKKQLLKYGQQWREGRGISHSLHSAEFLKQPSSKIVLLQAKRKCFQVYTGYITQPG